MAISKEFRQEHTAILNDELFLYSNFGIGIPDRTVVIQVFLASPFETRKKGWSCPEKNG